MMGYEKRNKPLLDRIRAHADHPAAEGLLRAAENCLSVSERFALARDKIAQNGHLTPEGVKAQLTDALRRTHGRDLRDARRPFEAAAANLKSMRARVKPSEVNRTDVVAALERQEIRAWMRSLDSTKQIATLMDDPDPRILDAVLDAPAAISGVPNEFYQRAIETRQEQLHGPLLREIEALEEVLGEAENAGKIARSDLMNIMEVDQRSFDRIMHPIENKAEAPWLKKDGDKVLVVVPGETDYRPATADQLRDGVYYTSAEEFYTAHGVKDQAEYLARRAA